MKALTLISLGVLNKQVENIQGQPLNIEGPPEEHMQWEKKAKTEN